MAEWSRPKRGGFRSRSQQSGSVHEAQATGGLKPSLPTGFDFGVRLLTALLTAVTLIGVAYSPAQATELRSSGALNAPPDAMLNVISTDPVVAEVLRQDLRAANRLAGTSSVKALTLTVTVSSRALMPGATVSDIAPGDPGVAALLRQAGASVPMLGGSVGGSPADPYAAAARQEALAPENPLMQQFNYAQQAANLAMGNGAPAYLAPHPAETSANQYDTAIVARAGLSGNSTGGLTVVAVLHPGANLHRARELIAEEIANAILH